MPVIFTIGIKFNTVLGIRLFSHFFDGSYQPIQNDEAFAFVDALIVNQDAHYDSAAALDMNKGNDVPGEDISMVWTMQGKFWSEICKPLNDI